MTSRNSNAPGSALRTKDAAEYLGCAPQTLENLRTADKKAMLMGEPTRGPRFVVLGRGLTVYRLADLDAWLDAHVVTPANVTLRKRASDGVGRQR